MPPSGDFRVHTVGEVCEGLLIMHERFGKGKIVAVHADPTGAKITVLFDNVAQRTLMLKYARFVIL